MEKENKEAGEERKESKFQKCWKFVKKHKWEIAGGITFVVTTVAAVVAMRNHNEKPDCLLADSTPDAVPLPVNEIVSEIIEEDVPVALNGDSCTATELSRGIPFISNRDMNKLLVENGMQEKWGDGYKVTELGRKYGGHPTYKETYAGYSFTNNEFDSAVLDRMSDSIRELQESRGYTENEAV